ILRLAFDSLNFHEHVHSHRSVSSIGRGELSDYRRLGDLAGRFWFRTALRTHLRIGTKSVARIPEKFLPKPGQHRYRVSAAITSPWPPAVPQRAEAMRSTRQAGSEAAGTPWLRNSPACLSLRERRSSPRGAASRPGCWDRPTADC